MRSQRSKNSRSQVRAAQLERAFFKELIWLAFLVAASILFLPLASQAGEYQAHEAKLSKLRSEIDKVEDEIRVLAKEKQHAANSEEKETLHKAMMALYKDNQKNRTDFEETQTHIRFKHPEKGQELDQKYTLQSLQPFSNFENDVTLDGKLDSFLHKMKGVYGESPKKKKEAVKFEKKSDPRAPASADKKKPFNPDDIDQPITLKK